MNINSGKGYFYSAGQRDAHLYNESTECYRAIVKARHGAWPFWASEAYYCGYWGLAL